MRSGAVSRSALEPEQVGRKVRLREVGLRDRRVLMGFDRDMAREATPLIGGGHRHWASHRSGSAGDDIHFGIETVRGRMLVGSVCTIGADPVTGLFGYGIGIAPRHQRCGYATDAITVLLAHMFEQRGFRKCEVSVYGGNLASLSLHGGLGFREEGRLRDTEVVRGEIKYLVRMGITAEEFALRRPDDLGGRGGSRGQHRRPRRGKHWRTPAAVNG
ncbi:acetyltransferase [Amycolatopsis regifaucium]|uniref:Acetyltransferase n=1 Tax=Amycolatopsis regifaucium TaxID=546365 RepID=A0A154MB05_9PSEU|nr:GNAT family protein [Amycolatopsis regifaucium]KZB81775.1 acetyltransferase [Amycolatopsis regifaucium]OKA06157.1 GNAT family N-acetyltransferase [Amycolatopsis regifaucium]SFG71141.1 Protein N-acetyltransferase, RimJ/RimL family [Amycolatopsis regifaucium]